MKLSYLFECHFNDDTTYQQTPEDISKTDPTRSAYFDVVQRKDDIMVFGLFNEDHTYVVDLRDGHFEIDGVPFNIRGDTTGSSGISVALPPDTKYELIYFRRHQHTVVVGQDIPTEELDHNVEYHFGWKTSVNGKEIQQTIVID